MIKGFYFREIAIYSGHEFTHVFFILLLIILSGFQVKAQYQVSSCSELGLRPVLMVQDNEGNVVGDDSSIISIYLDGDPSTGLGGLGCWVHHHPNGKDYVVTPYGWGQSPGPGRMVFIREAMQVINDTRAMYSELGTMDMNLHYLFDDIYYSRHNPDGSVKTTIYGSKFWLYDTNQCWMRSGVPTLRGLNSDQRKHVFAHEIGHCFNEENAPAFAWRWDSLNKWVQEGVAEYLSSELYKNNDFEHQFARSYEFDKPFYEQPYDSYVLFYYYSTLHGREAVVPLMRAIIGKETQRARIEHLQRSGFDQLFHEFLFDWTFDKILDSGGHIKIPKTDVGSDMLVDLDESMTKIEIDKKIENGQREIYILNVSEGYDITLRPISGSDLPFFQSLYVEGKEKIKFWDSEVEIKGNCSSPVTIQLMLSHLNAEDLEGLNFEYELKARTDCCDGAEGTLDACLIDSWEVDMNMLSTVLDKDVTGFINVTFSRYPAGQLTSKFNIRMIDRDNGDYQVHQGTISACIVPEDNDGMFSTFKLQNVTLGEGNVHTENWTYNGETHDVSENIRNWLSTFPFYYTACNQEMLTMLYAVILNRMQ